MSLELGQYLTLQDFCTCTETYARFAAEVSPLPESQSTIFALKELNEHVLDPLITHYGIDRFKLVYGFCSHDLRKRLKRKNPETGRPFGRVAPKLDQHISHELDNEGNPYCKRLGAAVDFKILGENTRNVMRWIIEAGLPFDRMYYFGPDRALHVSYGPEHNRYLCAFSEANVPEQRSLSDLVQLAKQKYNK